MIIVEFKDHATQQLALSNSHKLKDTEFSKVYINPDRTEDQRRLDRENRIDRNSLNDALPEKGQGRHRYGVESNEGNRKGFRYHYGARYGTVKKIYESIDVKRQRETVQVSKESEQTNTTGEQND